MTLCCLLIAVVTARMGPESFVAKGLVVLERNYLDVMKYERWEGHLLPDFTVGQVFQPSSLLLRESVTHPPPLLSEADLISVMDENGIGTDATIAEHISKIQTRQ
jgi:DNA topoisomerase III